MAADIAAGLCTARIRRRGGLEQRGCDTPGGGYLYLLPAEACCRERYVPRVVLGLRSDRIVYPSCSLSTSSAANKPCRHTFP